MSHSSLLPNFSEVNTEMNFLSTLLTPKKKVFYIPICVYHGKYTTWVWVCFLSIINTITSHASSFLWFGLVWFGFVPSEGLSSHSGDDADVSPGSQGDTVGFAHPALPLFLRVTASHPGKPWGPTLAHKARPKISKLGKLYPWAGGAAECPSRAASNQLPSHLEWRQPQGKQNQGMENEQVLKHFGEPRPPNQKPAPPRDFPGSGPNQVLFFFSGRSPKEHAGNQVLGSHPTCRLPSRQGFGPLSCHTGCPHALRPMCLDTVSFDWTRLQKTLMKTPGNNTQPAAHAWLTATLSVRIHWPLCYLHLHVLFHHVACLAFGWWM